MNSDLPSESALNGITTTTLKNAVVAVEEFHSHSNEGSRVTTTGNSPALGGRGGGRGSSSPETTTSPTCTSSSSLASAPTTGRTASPPRLILSSCPPSPSPQAAHSHSHTADQQQQHNNVHGRLLSGGDSFVSRCSHHRSPTRSQASPLVVTAARTMVPITADTNSSEGPRGANRTHSTNTNNSGRFSAGHCSNCISRRHKRIIAAAVEVVPHFKTHAANILGTINTNAAPTAHPPSSSSAPAFVDTDFTIRTLTGGLTNQLYLVRHVPSDKAVVVRRYGKETGKIISRESEEFWQSIFLKTYGRVGRHMLVYEFLDGHRTLSDGELKEWQGAIACKMAEMHAQATSTAIFRRTPQTGVAGIGAKGVWALGEGGGASAGVAGSNVSFASNPLLNPASGGMTPPPAAAGEGTSSPSLLASSGRHALQQDGGHSVLISPQPPPPAAVTAASAIGALNHTIAMLTEWVDQVKDLSMVRSRLAAHDASSSSAGAGSGENTASTGDDSTTTVDPTPLHQQQQQRRRSKVEVFDEELAWHIPLGAHNDTANHQHSGAGADAPTPLPLPPSSSSSCPSSFPIRLIQERDWLLSVIQHNASRLTTGVCHNDLLAGNIMVKARRGGGWGGGVAAPPMTMGASPSTQEAMDEALLPKDVRHFDLQFIDFEYTRRNYVFFDIGNHFNEYAGIDLNYANFPTVEEGRQFVRLYLGHGRALVEAMSRAMMTVVMGGREEADLHRTAGEGGASCASPPLPDPSSYVTDEEVAEATDLVFFFTLVSNFVWVTWSIIQALNSDIDFDYLDYAVVRWRRYLDTKEAFSRPVVKGMAHAEPTTVASALQASNHPTTETSVFI